MSNYDGPSKTLDDLRELIVRDDNGIAPADIVTLGRVAVWLEGMEMSLRAEKAKVAKLEVKINRWMPIVATSQESSELPEGWTWREPWKFSAEGPDGVVCEPEGQLPWCSDAPKTVMQVVGARSCSRAACIYANQVAKPLAERAYVRDTREGEWPENGQSFHEWDQGLWEPNIFIGSACMRGHLWLPAPPPPSNPSPTLPSEQHDKNTHKT